MGASAEGGRGGTQSPARDAGMGAPQGQAVPSPAPLLQALRTWAASRELTVGPTATINYASAEKEGCFQEHGESTKTRRRGTS